MELLGELERAFARVIYPNRLLIAIIVVLALAGLVLLARRRRWDRAVRRHPRTAVGALVVVLVVALPLGWWLGSPLFLSTTVDEPPPAAAVAPAEAPATVQPSQVAVDTGSEAPAAAATPGIEPAAAAAERAGSFAGADEFHFGEGTARLIEVSPGSFTVRLEDFAVRNGPDLFVYLSPSPDGYADGAIELGRLKADRGNQNYAVPAGTDTDGAASVVIWCREFSVLFATAPLG